MANRGLPLTGLRGGLTEPWVWFFSCLCFGLLRRERGVRHAPEPELLAVAA
jgi:hypothetical protein